MMNEENRQLETAYAAWQRQRTWRVAMRGLCVCTVGALLILRQQGSIPGDWHVWQLWPLILMYLGLTRLFTRPGLFGALAALGVTGAGGALLANNIGLVSVPWSGGDLWPVVVVLVGVGIMISAFTRPRWHHHAPWHRHGLKHAHWQHRRHWHQHQRQEINATIDDTTFERHVAMAAASFRLDTKAFAGGTLTANLSGVQLDLRQAEMAQSTAELFVTVTMSGMEIYVPEHWNVQVDVTPMLGGVEVKARGNQAVEGATVPTLVIRGQVTLGGIEVRN